MILLNYMRKNARRIHKGTIPQSDNKEETIERFWNAIEKYSPSVYIKDNENISIQHIFYHRATFDGVVDCLLFTYKNENRTEIFKRLKQSRQNPYNARFLPIIYDCIYDGEHTYVVEEAINGDNLGVIKEFREDGRFSQREVRNIARDVCRALEILHGLGILHLDVKPENIIAKADTSGYKLIDFNASVLIEDISVAQDYSYTSGYASPEHKNIRMADERTDQYSLGMTMSKLLANKEQCMNSPDNFEKLPGAKGELKNIIKKCTRLEKNERYKDVVEMRAALEGRRVRDDIVTEEEIFRHDLRDAKAENERLENDIAYLREIVKRYKKLCNTLLAGGMIILLIQIVYILIK